jgi:predicted kinase
VVLDASFRARSMRAAARDLARACGAPFLFVECRADRATTEARLVRRAAEGGTSDGRAAVWGAFAARFEPVTELAAAEHVVLDTTRPLATSIHECKARLPVWPRPSAA